MVELNDYFKIYFEDNTYINLQLTDARQSR